MSLEEPIRDIEELKKRLAELMAEAANNETILKRMQAHQEKKSSMLRQLRLASSFATAS